MEEIDQLDDEVLRVTSEFVEHHPELLVILDTRIPSVINLLSPRASAESQRDNLDAISASLLGHLSVLRPQQEYLSSEQQLSTPEYTSG